MSIHLLIPVQWASRVWALLVLTALCPSERYRAYVEKGRCHKSLARRARGLIAAIWRGMGNAGRPLVFVADSSYSALELLAWCSRLGARCIARQIILAEAAYCLALKGNHLTLQVYVETFFIDARQNGFKEIEHSFLETQDEGHGREETRRYWICEKVKWLPGYEDWSNLRSIGMVESIRKVSGKETVEQRFYLCSFEADAERFAKAVRGHWGIENSLNWVLDVAFNEDQCRVREGYAPENLATLRHIALNLLKQDTAKKRSIRGKQKNAGWDHRYLLSLLKI